MAARTRSGRGSKTTTRKSTERSKTSASKTRASSTRGRSSGRSGGTTAARRRSTTTRRATGSRRGTASSRELQSRVVSDVMSADPTTIVESEPLVSAARMMRDNDIGAVVVLADTDGRVCGIVTDRDIVVRAIAEDREPSQTAVGAVCSADLVTLEPDDNVDSAIAMMRSGRFAGSRWWKTAGPSASSRSATLRSASTSARRSPISARRRRTINAAVR